MDGLRRLEYRGYDSAGVALVDEATGELWRHRRPMTRSRSKTWRATWEIARRHHRYRPHPLATHAAPRWTTPTPMWTAPVGSPWCTTASSRTTPSGSGADRLGHRLVSETDTEVLAHMVEAAMGNGYA